MTGQLVIPGTCLCMIHWYQNTSALFLCFSIHPHIFPPVLFYYLKTQFLDVKESGVTESLTVHHLMMSFTIYTDTFDIAELLSMGAKHATTALMDSRWTYPGFLTGQSYINPAAKPYSI